MARYQYETSPRKVKTDYEIPNRRNGKKVNKVSKASKKQTQNVKEHKTLKKGKIVFYILVAFAVFFAISYRNAMIDIKYAKIKNLKTELSTVKKENEQIKANVEQVLNLKAVQDEATNNLGMKTLSTDQIEYINLSKKDHIESSVQNTEETNFFQKIIDYVTNLIK